MTTRTSFLWLRHVSLKIDELIIHYVLGIIIIYGCNSIQRLKDYDSKFFIILRWQNVSGVLLVRSLTISHLERWHFIQQTCNGYVQCEAFLCLYLGMTSSKLTQLRPYSSSIALKPLYFSNAWPLRFREIVVRTCRPQLMNGKRH